MYSDCYYMKDTYAKKLNELIMAVPLTDSEDYHKSIKDGINWNKGYYRCIEPILSKILETTNGDPMYYRNCVLKAIRTVYSRWDYYEAKAIRREQDFENRGY